MKHSVYQASDKDMNTVLKLSHELWPYDSLDKLLKEFSGLLANKECAIFILQVEREAVGFGQCQLRHDYVEGTESSPVGYLEGIYINDKYREQGLARELLRHCEQWAKEKGCSEFASDCELNNMASRGFHLSMGFEEVNRIICFKKKIV